MIPGELSFDDAELIVETDPSLPITLLAFFPEYKLDQGRSPTLHEMLQSYLAMSESGLQNLRLGNIGVIARTNADLALLVNLLGSHAIG